MILMIDDMRSIQRGVIARDYESGIAMLDTQNWQKLYLDHDLGSEEPNQTGYSIINWAIETEVIQGRTILPRVIEIVSDNPVGVKNIKDALMNHGYKILGNICCK